MKEAVGAAQAFIRVAERAHIPSGKPFINSDGEIGFTWEVSGDVATISFGSNGRYHAFLPRQWGNALRLSGRLEDASDILKLLHNF